MKTTQFALALVLAVLLSRAALVVAHGPPLLAGDTAQHDDLARNLVEGHGFAYSAMMLYPWQSLDNPAPQPTARRTPGFPILLAGLYVLGLDPVAMLWLHAVFAAMTAWIIYRMVLRLGASERAGLFAVALYLVYPPFWKNVLVLGTETMFVLLFLGAVMFYLRAVDSGRVVEYVIGGLLLGLATLTRPVTLVFPLVLAPFLLGRGGRPWRGWMAFTIVSVLVVSPWAIRNLVVFDHLEFSNSNKNWNLYVGTNPASYGRAELPREERDQDLVASWEGRSEFAVDSINRVAAIRNLQSPPANLAMLIAAKAIRLWIRTDNEPRFPTPSAKGLLFDLPILLFGVVGLVILFVGGHRHAWMPLAVVAFVMAAHLISIATFRYNIMAMPFVMIGLAVVMDWGVRIASGISGSRRIAQLGRDPTAT